MVDQNMCLERRLLNIGVETIACEFSLREKNVVILHGAGESESTRYRPLAEVFIDAGVGVLLFDFSGHGKSSGVIQELSLAMRAQQARMVIDAILPSDSTFYLVGFSMSGQTVCDLLPLYNDRIEAIVLACPAIYREEVRNMPFGSPMFTQLLRESESWKMSKAPSYLREFSGRTIIVIGDNDEVIPAGVIETLKGSARRLKYREYPAVTHQLAKWLSQHPNEQEGLVHDLLRA